MKEDDGGFNACRKLIQQHCEMGLKPSDWLLEELFLCARKYGMIAQGHQTPAEEASAEALAKKTAVARNPNKWKLARHSPAEAHVDDQPPLIRVFAGSAHEKDLWQLASSRAQHKMRGPM